LDQITYYRIAHDEDGPTHRSSLVQRPFTMALRWIPDIPIPEDRISATSRKRGDAPVDAGAVALHSLSNGGEIAQRHFDNAVAYLRDAIAFYAAGPDEPYPGRNDEAVNDLRELLGELT
jgi:hypothetical protein